MRTGRPTATRNRIHHVGVGDAVDGVHLVLVVEVGVEPVHHHDEIVPVDRRFTARIDDEHPVEALVDVAAQGNRVAVIEVQARGLRVELVHERLAGHHLLIGQRAVHLRRMPSVKVEGVRVRPLVDERHLQRDRPRWP